MPQTSQLTEFGGNFASETIVTQAEGLEYTEITELGYDFTFKGRQISRGRKRTGLEFKLF